MEAERGTWAVGRKWGKAVSSGATGFLAIPDLLIKHQGELRINATEFVVLLNILLHWWRADGLPHPRVSAIAGRMRVSKRTVERAIASLEEKGYVVWNPREQSEKGYSIRRFDLSGLVEELERIAERRQYVA